jgi:hypothetical protein
MEFHNPRIIVRRRGEPKKLRAGSSVIRQTFSMSLDDDALIDEIQINLCAIGVILNRSEVIRAGIAALRYLDADSVAEIIELIPKIKTGRP